MKFLVHFGLKHVPFHKGNTVLWDNQSLDELKNKVTIQQISGRLHSAQ